MRRRRSRRAPVRRRASIAAALAARPALAGAYPGYRVPDLEHRTRTFLTGAALVHAAGIALLFVLASLAPQMNEHILHLQILKPPPEPPPIVAPEPEPVPPPEPVRVELPKPPPPPKPKPVVKPAPPAPALPRPTAPGPAARAARPAALGQAPVAERRPGLRGVALSELLPCVSDAREQSLMQKTVAAARNASLCESPAGRFHFVETKNV